MKKLTIVAAFVFALFSVLSVSSNASFDDPGGKKIFKTEKCNTCHAVSTVGIAAKTKSEKLMGPDLVNLAEAYEAEWIVNYLRKEADLDGRTHKKPFKGTDEELQALVDWLLEQKSEG